MLRTRIRNIIGISIIIFIALFTFVIFKLVDAGYFEGLRTNFSSDWQDLLTQLKITKQNIHASISPSRKRPLTLVPQENLKQNLPYPFGEFSDAQWEYFWNLVYGLHETNDYGINYKPKLKRQLNIEEIEQILIREYPEVFGQFDVKAWQEFWAIVFKK